MAETELKNVDEVLKTQEEAMSLTRGTSMRPLLRSRYCGGKKTAISP